MSTDRTTARRNRLLAQLSDDTLDGVIERASLVELTLRHPLVEADRPILSVAFPLTAIASFVATLDGDVVIETGVIGNEGMTGINLVLGVPTSPQDTFCQVAGEVLLLDAEALLAAVAPGGELQSLLLRFAHTLMTQVAQNAACNRMHESGPRAARWLLQTGDRVGRADFALTQEFLGMMLGLRRATVSEAAGELAAAGAISYSRGQVRILDRDALERVACSCYSLLRRELAEVYAGAS